MAGTALYAFSPPVMYQAFLVNGGTETFALALVALLFFLRAYLDNRRTWVTASLCGLFSGLAYWGMDYALLYPIVFVLLWVFARGQRKWRWLGTFVLGFLVGCLPLILYNLGHDFGHIRGMFASAESDAGFLEHFFGAWWGVVSGDLASFFGGDIDDFKPASLDAWIHAGVVIIAVIVLIYRHRGAIVRAMKRHPLSSVEPSPLPAALLPIVFILAYLMMYAVAKFSLPGARTPRYFLPLCPFVSMAVALTALGSSGGPAAAKPRASDARVLPLRALGWVLVGALVVRGAVVSLQIGIRPWHEEHRIRASGEDIKRLATLLSRRGIRTVLAPYEIQWRLLFETDEEILASSDGISPKPRYDSYGEEFRRRVLQGGEPVAAVFTKDFRFAEKWGGMTKRRWYALPSRAAAGRKIPVPSRHKGCQGFVVFYPLFAEDLPRSVLVEPRPAP